MLPRGVPDGLDADASQRVLRSLLLVRIIRGSMLLLFLAAAVVAVELRGWPSGVALALGLAIVLQAVALASWCRRYASSAEASRTGSAP